MNIFSIISPFHQQEAFGMDLSDFSVKTAQLKRTRHGIGLSSYGRQDIPAGIIDHGEIKQIDELSEIIMQAVANVKGASIRTKHCVVSLPETEAFVRIVRLPKMKEKEIGEAIKWETENHIPMSIDEVYFDWQIVEPLEYSPEHSDVLVGALSKKLVDPYLAAIKKAGFAPIAFEIESIATAGALIKDGLSPDPVMLVDLGARRASFSIFSGRAVQFTASSPISNTILVEDISKALGVDMDEAKKLKISAGMNKEKEEGRVFAALKPRVIELIEQIKKYAEFYRSHALSGHFKSPDVKKIILCGGGANLSGLRSFLAEELKLEVETGNPWANILKSSPDANPDLMYEQSIGYATVLGLALEGLAYSKPLKK